MLVVGKAFRADRFHTLRDGNALNRGTPERSVADGFERAVFGERKRGNARFFKCADADLSDACRQRNDGQRACFCKCVCADGFDRCAEFDTNESRAIFKRSFPYGNDRCRNNDIFDCRIFECALADGFEICRQKHGFELGEALEHSVGNGSEGGQRQIDVHKLCAAFESEFAERIYGARKNQSRERGISERARADGFEVRHFGKVNVQSLAAVECAFLYVRKQSEIKR